MTIYYQKKIKDESVQAIASRIVMMQVESQFVESPTSKLQFQRKVGMQKYFQRNKQAHQRFLSILIDASITLHQSAGHALDNIPQSIREHSFDKHIVQVTSSSKSSYQSLVFCFYCFNYPNYNLQ